MMDLILELIQGDRYLRRQVLESSIRPTIRSVSKFFFQKLGFQPKSVLSRLDGRLLLPGLPGSPDISVWLPQQVEIKVPLPKVFQKRFEFNLS